MTRFGIGQAITRREDQRLLTGTGQYVDDMSVTGEAHLVFVRSPHAHASINRVDTAAAKAMPGVVAVITAAEMHADGVNPFPTVPPAGTLKRADGQDMCSAPYYPLAKDEVRFVGEAVAVVIAETRSQAEDAAEKVVVDYKTLPVSVTIADAMKPGAPLVWKDAPGNIAAQTEFGKKAECDAAFAKAKHITQVDVINQRLVPVSMEPRGTLAEFDKASGRITLWTSCQNPAGLRDTLADAILKMPKDKIRVRVGDVGGGFGMKTMLYAEDAVCAYAARKIGRAVHWRATRSEEFLASTHGRDQINHAELALDAQGKVLGMRINILGNRGGGGPKGHHRRVSLPCVPSSGHRSAHAYQPGVRLPRRRQARSHLSCGTPDGSGRR